MPSGQLSCLPVAQWHVPHRLLGKHAAQNLSMTVGMAACEKSMLKGDCLNAATRRRLLIDLLTQSACLQQGKRC